MSNPKTMTIWVRLFLGATIFVHFDHLIREPYRLRLDLRLGVEAHRDLLFHRHIPISKTSFYYHIK